MGALDSAKGWLSLGSVNWSAHLAMVASKQHTDNIMCALPDGERMSEKIEAMKADLLKIVHDSTEEYAAEERRLSSSMEEGEDAEPRAIVELAPAPCVA